MQVHGNTVWVLFKMFGALAGLPVLGLLGCILLWRKASSPDDPAEAQTLRLGLAATGASYVAALLTLGAAWLPPGSRWVPPGSLLLMSCVVGTLAACMGLALVVSNARGTMRGMGVLLSLVALLFCVLFGLGLLAGVAG